GSDRLARPGRWLRLLHAGFGRIPARVSERRLEEEIILLHSGKMDIQDIQRLLEDVRAGKRSVTKAVEQLRHMPYEDLGFAKIDHHRGLRQGFAEVVYAKGKTPQQVVAIIRGILLPQGKHNVLITRADAGIFRAVRRVNRAAEFHPLSGTIGIRRNREIVGKGTILVVAAGTSDIPAA